MSTLSAVEAPVVDLPEGAAPGRPGSASVRRPLQLVRPAAVPDDSGDGGVMPHEAEPCSSSIDAVSVSVHGGGVLIPSAVIAPRPPRGRAQVSSPPLRLTRRGRVVVSVLFVAVIAAIALVVGLAAAGGAQATSHGQPGGGYQGMHEIVVRPGQTLWSIASAAEPGADPRNVVQQIMTANAMAGTTISAGQLLWVPR
jgi:LysM domain